MKAQCQTIRLVTVLAAILVVSALGSGHAAAQFIITELIDDSALECCIAGKGPGKGARDPARRGLPR